MECNGKPRCFQVTSLGDGPGGLVPRQVHVIRSFPIPQLVTTDLADGFAKPTPTGPPEIPAAERIGRTGADFIKLPTAALRTIMGLSPGCLPVYLTLASHADAKGRCWPSLATVAAESHLNRRWVIRLLGMLEGAGLLHRHRRPSKPTKHETTIYLLPHFCSGVQATSSPERVVACKAAPSGVQATRGSGVQATQNRSSKTEPRTSSSSTAKAVSDQPLPHDDEDEEDFAKFWKAYPRKTKRVDAQAAFREAITTLIQKGVTRPEAVQRLVKAAQAYRQTNPGQDGEKFVKLAANWLRERRYEDHEPAADDSWGRPEPVPAEEPDVHFAHDPMPSERRGQAQHDNPGTGGWSTLQAFKERAAKEPDKPRPALPEDGYLDSPTRYGGPKPEAVTRPPTPEELAEQKRLQAVIAGIGKTAEDCTTSTDT